MANRRQCLHRVGARRNLQRSVSGWTLIELLIVIAIIAILASMLLSGLKTVRVLYEQVQCASSLRQIGMAHAAYASDNRGVVCPTAYFAPTDYASGANDYLNWSKLLWPYTQDGQDEQVAYTADQARNHSMIYTCRQAVRYREQTLISWAEAGTEDSWCTHSYGQNLFPGLPESTKSSYLGGGWYDIGGGSGLFRFSGVTMATSRPLVMEAIYAFVSGQPHPADFARWAFPGYREGGPARHHGKSNVLFFDLHVQGVSAESVSPATTDPSSTRM